MRIFSFYAAKINKIRLTNHNFYDINIVIGCEGNNAGFERFQRERSASGLLKDRLCRRRP